MTTGAQARDSALRVVEQNASAAWKADAKEAVREVALREPYFTSDALWAWLSVNSSARTHEHRALGSIMSWAHRKGIIEPTERFVPSAKPQQHHQPLRMWKSLLYRGTM